MMLVKSVQSLWFEAQEEDVPRVPTFTSRIQVHGKARQWIIMCTQLQLVGGGVGGVGEK